MPPTPQHHMAAAIAESALAIVFGHSSVTALREDSPLSAVGLVSADLVCVSDAVSAEAGRRGASCVLDDEALADVQTVGDLVSVIEVGLEPDQDVR